MKWIINNPELFGVCIAFGLTIATSIGWLIRKAFVIGAKMQDHEDRIGQNTTGILELKNDQKETNKEILSQLRGINDKMSVMACSISKLEGYIERDKEKRNVDHS